MCKQDFCQVQSNDDPETARYIHHYLGNFSNTLIDMTGM